MHVLNPKKDPDNWLARARGAARVVLFLDYDGTIAAFVVDRHKALPYPGVGERLIALASDPRCRLVLVTGRMVKDLLPLLELPFSPEVFGAHGWERYRDGKLTTHALTARVEKALATAHDFATRFLPPNRCERKPCSVALHWRGLADDRVRRLDDEAYARLSPLKIPGELELIPFDGGLELRATARDKGTAVREVLAEEPPSAIAAYLGDDVTDEDGFRALRPQDLGVLVRADLTRISHHVPAATKRGEKCGSRATAADVWIVPPAEVLAFLDEVLLQPRF